MAGDAALRFYRDMLKRERPRFLSVTGETNLILRGCGAQLVCKKATMRIVAITAFHQTFIHPVVERLGEIWLYIKMAGVTQLRLCGDEQFLLHPGRMNGVAINAPDIILNVFRAEKVGVLLIKLMASEAAPGRIYP